MIVSTDGEDLVPENKRTIHEIIEAYQAGIQDYVTVQGEQSSDEDRLFISKFLDHTHNIIKHMVENDMVDISFKEYSSNIKGAEFLSETQEEIGEGNDIIH